MNDVQRGDVFALGDHRLMCGDSTDPEDVSKLMDGRTAKMVFTSPPYADIRTYGGDKNLDPQHLAKFIAAYRPYCDLYLVNLGTKRQNYEIIPYWNVYTKAANDADLKLVSINIWDKGEVAGVGALTAVFPIRHEYIFVYNPGTKIKLNKTVRKNPKNMITLDKKISRRNADGSISKTPSHCTRHPYKTMDSIVKVRPNKNNTVAALHPSQFPVALPLEHIRAVCDEGDIVIDPFGGGGTTLIAAERTNGRRESLYDFEENTAKQPIRCFTMELDPGYCKIAIERWEKETGMQAERAYCGISSISHSEDAQIGGYIWQT